MKNKSELIVLYRNNDGYHEILLNDLELCKIRDEINKIFLAKKSNVIVDETKLKIVKEV